MLRFLTFRIGLVDTLTSLILYNNPITTTMRTIPEIKNKKRYLFIKWIGIKLIIQLPIKPPLIIANPINRLYKAIYFPLFFGDILS